ncbi:hypothetical protein EBX93_04150 [bacterium]|nr:hypothetical protein [bacterium]
MEFINTIQETPLKVWKKYKESECAYVDDIFTSREYKWNLLVAYPDVKCIKFEYCDRGIPDWNKFGFFLKTAFPNLEVLLLQQNCTYNPNNDIKQDILDFLRDTWLHYIWIEDLQTDLKIEDVQMPFGCQRMFNTGIVGNCSNCKDYSDEYDETLDRCKYCIKQDEFNAVNRQTVSCNLYLTQADIYV